MTSNSLIVCGLPGSGKTTFLAALWHIVQSGEIDTVLKLASLDFAEYEYVNSIRERWLKGQRQIRTVGAAKTVGIDLHNSDAEKISLLFPDHSGETFDNMWTTRTCPEDIADLIADRVGGLLFLRQNVKQPTPLTEVMVTESEMEEALASNAPAQPPPPTSEKWRPEDAPDQVKIIDTIQSLTNQFSIGSGEKFAVFVSAWDLVANEMTPETFIQNYLPLLHQYLEFGEHGLDIRVYGLSAQGGQYIDDDHEGPLPRDLESLLSLDAASSRIQLIYDGKVSHDLTEPIAWLMA